MGGFFGIVSSADCVRDLFYGTDYHSHLGTMRGGMAVMDAGLIGRHIHDITTTQFRAKFQDDIHGMRGVQGIGVISDYDDQPLVLRSHLGTYAIVTIGKIANLDEVVHHTLASRRVHLSEMEGGRLNPTEVVGMLINQGSSFVEGIRDAQETIRGSCSLLLLTDEGIYAARDALGRTPVVIGRRGDDWAVTMETCAFPNLDIEVERFLGPGEVVCLSPEGLETKAPAGQRMQICTFLWVYYGYPASTYEGINVEEVRNRCGAALALKDNIAVDMVAGIPDSGTGHALGYAAQSGLPYRRPFVKYTPTWPRSFLPSDQETRELVARMKLIPVRELIRDKRLLFCEDSIVRGTQLRDTIQRLYDCGAREVHMRPACPALVYSCPFLNFSRSRSELDLASRRAIRELAPGIQEVPAGFSEPSSELHHAMVERIRRRLRLTTLRYQELDDLVTAVGLPRERLCTYCWNGVDRS